jgi:hypothetical protein
MKQSPLLARRGGRDAKKISRSVLLWSGRGGGFRSTKVYLSNLTHHPVRGFAADAPPGQEGRSLDPTVKYVIALTEGNNIVGGQNALGYTSLGLIMTV